MLLQLLPQQMQLNEMRHVFIQLQLQQQVLVIIMLSTVCVQEQVIITLLQPLQQVLIQALMLARRRVKLSMTAFYIVRSSGPTT